MKDASGKEMKKSVEYSLQNQCWVQASKLDKAIWILAHTTLNDHNTTKQNMRDAINEATISILEVKKWLIGDQQ